MFVIAIFLDIIHWPTTQPGVIGDHTLADGLSLCFSVMFWHLTQQDVRFKDAQGYSILTLRMTVSPYSGIS
jgi:hypothetical protein